MTRRGRRQKLKGGDEWDWTTRWRRLLNWAPGVGKALKRKMNKRARRGAKEEISYWCSVCQMDHYFPEDVLDHGGHVCCPEDCGMEPEYDFSKAIRKRREQIAEGRGIRLEDLDDDKDER